MTWDTRDELTFLAEIGSHTDNKGREGPPRDEMVRFLLREVATFKMELF